MKITNEGRSLAGLGALIPSDGIPEGGTPPPDCCDVGADPIDRGADGSAVGLSAPGTATLVQSAAFGNGGDTGAILGPHSLPGVPTVGNVLIAILGSRGLDWDDVTLLPYWPAGWTTLVGNNFAGVESQGQVIRAKVVTSSADQDITFGASITGSLILSEWSGFGGVLPTVDTSATSDVTDDDTPAVPAVTPTASTPILLIGSVWKKAAGPNPGPSTLSAYTLVDDTAYVGLGNRHRLTAWYQWVASTSGTYGPTSISSTGDGTDDSNVIHAALAGAGGYGSAWVIPEPNVTDGDDATYDTITGTDLLRIDLGAPFRITSTRVRIAANTSGSRTFTIKGANAVDFSDEVTLATIAFTATGSYTAQNVTGSWSTTDEYRYFELSIGTSDTYRIHAWELFGGTLAGDLATHSHTLDGLSDVDTTGVGDGDVLTYDSGSGSWIADAPAGGSLALDDLTDVNAPSPADGDALVWDAGASEWVSGAVAAAGGGTTAFIGARVYNSGTQTVGNTTTTTLLFDSERFDTDSIHDTGSNTGRLTVPAGMGGKWLVGGYVQFASDNDGVRFTYIIPSTGIEVAYDSRASVQGDVTRAQINSVVTLAAGDYVELKVYHDAGGNLAVTAEFWMVKLDSGKVGAGIGATATSSSDQTITTATPTAVTFATEDFDTDGFHSTSVNTSRLTIPAGLGGKYLVVGYLIWDSAGSNIRQARIYKNGSSSGYANSSDASSTYIQQTVEAVLDLAAGDYVELFAYHERGSDLAVMGTIVSNKLSVMRLDSGPAATSGTAFPSSPATGYKFFRTDLGLECYWDGTNWLTTALFSHTFGDISNKADPNGSVTLGYFAMPSAYDIWVVSLHTSLFVNGTTNGSNYWTVKLQKSTAGNVQTDVGSGNTTAADTTVNWTARTETIGASVAVATYKQMQLVGADTGTPGNLFGQGRMHYRLIVT